MADYRFYINDREVFPLNNRNIKINRKLIDETYYQKSLSSTIILKDSDYEYLKVIQNNKKWSTSDDLLKGEYSMYDRLSFKIEPDDYIGEFMILDCAFNDYFKTVEVKVTTRDAMTYIKENETKEVDIMPAISNFYKVKAERYTYYSFINIKRNATPEFVRDDEQYIDTDLYTLLYNDWNPWIDDPHQVIINQSLTQVWVSEITYFPNDDIVDSSWTKVRENEYVTEYQRQPSAITGDIIDNRYHSWIGNPDNLISFRDFYDFNVIGPYQSFTRGYWTKKQQVPKKEDYINNPEWFYLGEFNLKFPTSKIEAEAGELIECTFFLAIKTFLYQGYKWDGITYNSYRGIDLKSLLNATVSLSCPDFKGKVVSSFLFNDISDDPENPDDFYNNENIKLLKGNSRVRFVCDMLDYIRPTASELSRYKKVTLRKIMDAFKNMGFNVGVDINKNGDFRIEHISFYKRKQNSKNLKVWGSKIRELPKKWEYNSMAVPNRAVYECTKAWNTDFKKININYNVRTYDGTNEIVEEFSQEYFCTDIDGLGENIADINTEGFVMLECNLQPTGIYKVESGFRGTVSNLIHQNISLSLANLVSLYHIHNAYKPVFYLENVELKAKSVKNYKTEKLQVIDEIFTETWAETGVGNGQITSIEYPLVAGDKLINIELLHE